MGAKNRVSKLATSAVMTPVTGTARVVGFSLGAKKAAAETLAKLAGHRKAPRPEAATDEQAASSAPPAGVTETAVPDAPAPETVAAGEDGQAVELLPYPQLQDPIPVVEQVLEAEAAGEPTHHAGHATEPKAASRDEEHGDAQLQRAEEDEIAEEVAEAFPGGDLDVETPVGTTGADAGFNPDTAEADLQQPGTAAGIDDGLVSSVLKDEQRGLEAAKGPRERS